MTFTGKWQRCDRLNWRGSQVRFKLQIRKLGSRGINLWNFHYETQYDMHLDKAKAGSQKFITCCQCFLSLRGMVYKRHLKRSDLFRKVVKTFFQHKTLTTKLMFSM
jgi:hypothetical protein